MPKRTYEDSLVTKQNILNTAKRLFSRRGYERTSLSDVAKYAGVTRGAIYWHFSSKEDLLLGLLEKLNTDLFSNDIVNEAMSPAEADPLGKLKQFLLVLVQEDAIEFFNSTFMTMLLTIMNGGSGNVELREKIYAQRKRHVSNQTQIIKNAVNKGQLPKNLVIEAAVEHLEIFLIGYIHSCRVNNVDLIKKNFSYYLDLEFELMKKLTKETLV